MRKVSIIGAGQGGLMLGIGLLDQGYEVTMLSDRTPEEIRYSIVPSSAGLSQDAQDAEAELGLALWDSQVKTMQGVHFEVVAPDGIVVATVKGPWGEGTRDWRAIDLRLKCSRWIKEFEDRGGKLLVKPATIEDVEEHAENSDLTVIAAGKGEISGLFERDPERSMFAEPQRNISMVVLKGHPGWEDKAGFRPLHFMNFIGRGEIFGGHFLNTTEESAIFLIFEAVPGGPMDLFGSVTSGEEQLEVCKRIVQENAPQEYERMENVELADENAAIRGRITPTVRKPVATLPSGRIVMGLGDTLVLKDPIGGQGANSAAKGARHFLARIRDRGDRPFDGAWMQETFDLFWDPYEQFADRFNNGLMLPLEDFQKQFIFAASERPELAAKLFGAFTHPPSAFPWFVDADEAQKVLATNPTKAPIA